MFFQDAGFAMEKTALTENIRRDPADGFLCFFFYTFFPVCCLPPAQACIISSQFCTQRYAAPWPPRAISQIFRCFNTLHAPWSLIIPPETDLKRPHYGRDWAPTMDKSLENKKQRTESCSSDRLVCTPSECKTTQVIAYLCERRGELWRTQKQNSC